MPAQVESGQEPTLSDVYSAVEETRTDDYSAKPKGAVDCGDGYYGQDIKVTYVGAKGKIYFSYFRIGIGKHTLGALPDGNNVVNGYICFKNGDGIGIVGGTYKDGMVDISAETPVTDRMKEATVTFK